MSQSIEMQQKQKFSLSIEYDVAIVGAGPYGLATAAHLSGQGLNVIVFGKPMQLWREHMPQGMLLRSYWWATNISDPNKQYGLERFCQLTDRHPVDPMARETVIDYGLWFYQQTIPNADQTYVKTIERQGGQFTLTLEDERTVTCEAVVMAPGLGYYVHRPAEYCRLPSQVLSHTADHNSFECFAGQSLAIIGGGQSALETAALAHEAGVHVQLITRSPLVWIQDGPSFPEHRSLLERIRSPKAGIAPGWFSWQLEHLPYLFQSLPRAARDRLLRGRGSYGPMGASWLKPRVLGQVDLHELQRVVQLQDGDNGVEITLSNHKRLNVDHVMLATGYRADVKRLPMLHTDLLPQIKTYRDAPILSNTFESTVPGLYFIGFTSVLSCGPLYRFVVGTDAAARQVTRAVSRHLVRTGKRGRQP
jgi:thioredoxin reductase